MDYAEDPEPNNPQADGWQKMYEREHEARLKVETELKTLRAWSDEAERLLRTDVQRTLTSAEEVLMKVTAERDDLYLRWQSIGEAVGTIAARPPTVSVSTALSDVHLRERLAVAIERTVCSIAVGGDDRAEVHAELRAALAELLVCL